MKLVGGSVARLLELDESFAVDLQDLGLVSENVELDGLAKMLDFAGPSFDFNTRMNALSYLSYLPIDADLYWQRLFEAFQNKNWKLSKKGREKLLDLQSKEAAQFKKAYRKAKRDWDDFQKRKAERTFEKE